MFSPQARINARTIRKDRITPTTAAALRLAADFALFILFVTAACVMARGFYDLFTGDLAALHAQAKTMGGV